MHSDSWGDTDNEPEASVLDAFDYAAPPRHHDDDADDWTDGIDSPEINPSSNDYSDGDHDAFRSVEQSTEFTSAGNDSRGQSTPDADEPTAPFVFAVSVNNPAGTITATATISGWLQRIELTPDVRSMTEYDLARDIVATAQLASVKGQASQHTLVQDMLTYQGLDQHAARDYIDQYMNLPTPDQAAAAQSQARARYLRGEY
jgi:hypothetical protein